jgi:hypothetical protein
MSDIKLLNIETGETETWTVPQVLDYINEDRNPEWIDYTSEDWLQGWNAFCEGLDYQLLSHHA